MAEAEDVVAAVPIVSVDDRADRAQLARDLERWLGEKPGVEATFEEVEGSTGSGPA